MQACKHTHAHACTFKRTHTLSQCMNTRTCIPLHTHMARHAQAVNDFSAPLVHVTSKSLPASYKPKLECRNKFYDLPATILPLLPSHPPIPSNPNQDRMAPQSPYVLTSLSCTRFCVLELMIWGKTVFLMMNSVTRNHSVLTLSFAVCQGGTSGQESPYWRCYNYSPIEQH